MARPRNEKLKGRIRAAAWKLFATEGYEATSYTAVAEAVGISRNLVQYHFPKKDLLAAELFDDVLSRTCQALDLDDDDLRNNLEGVYAVGAVYFTYLESEGGLRLFLSDVLKSRALTRDVCAFNAPWILGHVADAQGTYEYDGDAKAVRTLVGHLGGFYELLFYELERGGSLDAGEALSPVMKALATALGYPMAQVYALTPRNALADAPVQGAVRKLQEAYASI